MYHLSSSSSSMNDRKRIGSNYSRPKQSSSSSFNVNIVQNYENQTFFKFLFILSNILEINLDKNFVHLDENNNASLVLSDFVQKIRQFINRKASDNIEYILYESSFMFNIMSYIETFFVLQTSGETTNYYITEMSVENNILPNFPIFFKKIGKTKCCFINKKGICNLLIKSISLSNILVFNGWLPKITTVSSHTTTTTNNNNSIVQGGRGGGGDYFFRNNVKSSTVSFLHFSRI